MKNEENLSLQELKTDNILKSKRGLSFIIASVPMWTAILIIHKTTLPIVTKNMLTFCCLVPLVPMAYIISKFIGVVFYNKNNPFAKLGILFAINQILYILIAMWVYSAVPDKMLMVYAIIFGAHLFPYGWLYQSKAYYALSVIICALALFIGYNYSPFTLAALMLFLDIIFCICLIVENKKDGYFIKT